MGINLNGIKLRIYEYVESRMSFIAPNLSAIIGASTAAKIMGIVIIFVINLLVLINLLLEHNRNKILYSQ